MFNVQLTCAEMLQNFLKFFSSKMFNIKILFTNLYQLSDHVHFPPITRLNRAVLVSIQIFNLDLLNCVLPQQQQDLPQVGARSAASIMFYLFKKLCWKFLS